MIGSTIKVLPKGSPQRSRNCSISVTWFALEVIDIETVHSGIDAIILRPYIK